MTRLAIRENIVDTTEGSRRPRARRDYGDWVLVILGGLFLWAVISAL